MAALDDLPFPLEHAESRERASDIVTHLAGQRREIKLEAMLLEEHLSLGEEHQAGQGGLEQEEEREAVEEFTLRAEVELDRDIGIGFLDFAPSAEKGFRARALLLFKEYEAALFPDHTIKLLDLGEWGKFAGESESFSAR